MGAAFIAVSVVPAASAIWLWALKDTQRFFLWGVLTAMVLPVALLRPAGTRVALADILLLIGLGAWLVAASVHAAPLPWLRGNMLFAPMALFVLINVLSLGWTTNVRESIQTIVQMTEIVIVFPLAFATLPRDLRVIRIGLMCFVVASCALATVALILAAPDLAAGRFKAPQLQFGLNKNAAGSYIAAGLVVAYAFWLKASALTTHRLLLLAIAIEGLGLLATLSRGSLIGAGVSLLLVSVLLRRRRLATAAAVFCLTTAFLATAGPNPGSDLRLSGSYTSSRVRVYSFSHAIKKIEKHPVLGTGSGTYSDYIEKLGISLPDPNNMFLLTWAEVGILGVGALALLLTRFTALWLRVRKLSEEAAVIGVASGGVALSLLLHFQFDATWTRGSTSLAFAAMGLMLAAQRLGSEAEREGVTHHPVAPLRMMR